ncbi:type IV pilus assembly protein PilM [Quadrisphaera granulorum]|uniref:Type IV pilus assembly protein PilM n=1 Tax=Quadrisphaera granulorum TaxID=317664 RepID=A0A315ZRS5_9ACTN|nr:type IV pilus assembly protein PilM [Quadrisphaera granulorum]PWJ47999.1 type IV pilus assembly protein PilM [Quadrisphaera granulorum]SZE98571.1 type IV pilus assembly protein PilM [Quadrisphaera granulorum]
MRAKGIGLDIGSAALRAAELSFGSGGAVLRREAQVELPEGAVVDGVVQDAAAVTAAVKQLWKTGRFSSRTVQLGMANRRVMVRQIDLPDLPEADLAQALPFQVADVLSIPVDEAVLDFHLLERLNSPSGAVVQRGLLVAAPREDVLRNVHAVEAAGLRVGSVDLVPFAVMRAVGSRWHEQGPTEMVVDIGGRITTLTIHTGGVPHLVRILQAGGSDITAALARAEGTTEEEAELRKLSAGLDDTDAIGNEQVIAAGLGQLMDEVRSSLDYHASTNSRFPVTSVVLTGGGSQFPGTADYLEAVVDLPVRFGSTVRFRSGEGAQDDDVAGSGDDPSVVAIGLALAVAS